MEHQGTVVRDLSESPLQHVPYNAEVGNLRYGIAHDLAVVQIQDGGEIELLSVHFEFGDVRGPSRVRLHRLETAIQPIGGYFADLTSIGTIPLGPQHTAEVLFPHELHDQFVVGLVPPLAQSQGDPPIPIASFMLCADLEDRLPLRNVLFEPGETCGVVIIAAPGKMRNLKQRGQRIGLP